MKMQFWQKKVLYGALSTGLLAGSYGCGGGGGNSEIANPPPTAAAPQPTPVLASGVITGFGSVFVNGARYEVESDTVVDFEDEAERVGDDSDLRIGMKVRVRAEEDENGVRVAQRIEYDEDLKGPARNVIPDADDPRIGTFEAVGVAVIVDANTVFDDDVGDNNGDGNIDIRDLEVADGEVVVEVSGLPGPAGLVATRIDRVNGPAGVPGTDDDEYEVKGFVESVASDGGSFVVSGTTFLVVDGAGGTIFEDGLSIGPELEGVFVEVKADENAMGAYVAVEVEREDDIGDHDEDGDFDDDDRFGDLEIEGILVSVNTSADPHEIVINGTTIKVTDASSLVALEGARVEIEGSFDDNGVLTLREAEAEGEHNVRTTDRVAQTDPGAGTITTRLGLVIEPTGLSRVEDDAADSDEGDHRTPSEFVERVQPGDYLEARGIPNADGSVTWTRVERDDDGDPECELRGPVVSIDGTDASSFSFEIQGVTIDVSQIISESNFGGIGRQNFFDKLRVGDVVEAESDELGTGCESGRLTAREVEFENDDGVFGTGNDDDGNVDNELVGAPENVTENSFVLGGRTITVNGSTLIDDSIIERALGQEFDGDDQRFDQVPGGLTLADLLPGTFPVEIEVDADGVALRIEDL
jgi:hypothetical protein